ncbi:MAG: hypothetical protein AAGA46_03535 [Cyanobacteria bacterium P01_F01_bin.13]
MEITFLGHIPSKKNSRRNFRGVSLPSKAHETWKAIELPTLQGLKGFDGPVRIDYAFYPGSLRMFDVSNAIESINDLLVEACILVDDNWLYLRESTFAVPAVDKGNERCVVSIHALEPTHIDLALAVLRDKSEVKKIAQRWGCTQKAVRETYEDLARGAAA